jgi:hypothetical protein
MKRRTGLIGQRVAGGEVIAVAEDGAQRVGDGARGGLAAHEVLVDAERFKRAMQPEAVSA